METTAFPTSSSNEKSTGGSTNAAVHSGIDKVADPARQAVDRMTSAAHDTVEKVASAASRYSEVPVRALETSKSWVQEKPLQAVGTALAIGFILGRLTSN
jgi:ElaB/YqjD/DUF883 family membrane-anchored ribosome-binding protein